MMAKKPQHPRVLVIEDEKDSASLLERLLSNKFKAESVMAKDCAEARDALGNTPFDLITLDFKLPDGDGFKLLQEIVAEKGHPPVIMVTGQGDETTASLAIGLGVDGYVVKDNRMAAMLTRAVEGALEKERYRKSLVESERQYRELVELANTIILKMDGEGNLLFINKYGAEFFGYKASELVGRNVVGTIVPEVESTGRGLSSLIRDIVTDPDSHRSNFNQNMLRNGKRVWILWANRSIRDGDGNVTGTLSIGNDVTELLGTTARLERSKRIYSLLTAVIQDLPEVREPRELYDRACWAAVESGLFRMAWIGMLDDKTDDIIPVASAGDDDKYLENVEFSTGGSGGNQKDPVETAVRDCRSCIDNDILQQNSMEIWRKEAIRCGYGSLAAFPLVLGDRAIGVICLFADTTGFFDGEITQLLELVARNISFAVEAYGCKS